MLIIPPISKSQVSQMRHVSLASLANHVVEGFAELASNKPIEVELSENKPTLTLAGAKFFTSTTVEVLTYSLSFGGGGGVGGGDDEARLRLLVTLDSKSGTLLIKSRGPLKPGDPGVAIADGAFVITYAFDVYATNQWNKRSPAARVSVKEIYVQGPEVVSAIPQLNLNELVTSATVDLSRIFRDSQGRGLTYTITSTRNSDYGFDPNTKVFTVRRMATLSEPLVTYTLRFAASNGVKSVSLDAAVRDEFILPPVLAKSLPTGMTLVKGGTSSFTVNLADYFKDAPHNAGLLVTKGVQTVSYAVVGTNPADMQSAVALSGSTLTVKTIGRQQAYTITVKATNASSKSVTGEIRVQDTQPIDCQVSGWGGWNGCSASCGGGWQSRSRTVTVQPQNGGAGCPTLSESQSCNTHSCRVDCGYTTSSGPCNAGCGYGQRYQTYNIYQYPAGGGTACPNSGWVSCFERSCPQPPPPPPPNPLPSGSYAWSCDSCSANGWSVTCNCRRMNGSYNWTTASGCGSYDNIDGNLRCG